MNNTTVFQAVDDGDAVFELRFETDDTGRVSIVLATAILPEQALALESALRKAREARERDAENHQEWKS